MSLAAVLALLSEGPMTRNRMSLRLAQGTDEVSRHRARSSVDSAISTLVHRGEVVIVGKESRHGTKAANVYALAEEVDA